MRRWSWCAAAVVAMAWVLACGPGKKKEQPPEKPPELAPEDKIVEVSDAVAPELDVQVGCSEAELRTPMVTIAWKADKEPGPDDRVDVGGGKRGLDNGQFVSLTMGAGARISHSKGLARVENSLGHTMALEVEKVAHDPREKRALVAIKKLEPGVLYQVRVAHKTDRGWAATKPVRITVPPCVADIVGEEDKP